MPNMTRLLLSAAALSVWALAAPADAAGVKIGVLRCNVDSGWGFIFGSSRGMQCAFRSDRGEAEYYRGTLSSLGVDIGYRDESEIVWDVIAPTPDAPKGALQGDYAGVLPGADAHVLVGGFEKSIALQPVSVEGESGLDVAAGIGGMNLRADAALSPRVLRFEVYFESDSIYLSPEGGAQVAHAVNAAEERGLMRVLVVGAPGAVEPDPYDGRISDQRALSVRNELLRDGLTRATISIEGRPVLDPGGPTDLENRERESRRVTIELTGSPPDDPYYR